MEALNIKLKDVIQFALYLILFVGFLITMDNKIDEIAKNQADAKTEKKELSFEQKQINFLIQTELKSLGVTAEVNKSNIGINKIDIALLNAKVDKLLNKE